MTDLTTLRRQLAARREGLVALRLLDKQVPELGEAGPGMPNPDYFQVRYYELDRMYAELVVEAEERIEAAEAES